MKHSVAVAKATRTTWRTHARDIAEALGIPVSPQQWVTLEDGESDDELPLTGAVDVVIWERVAVNPETDQARVRELAP